MTRLGSKLSLYLRCGGSNSHAEAGLKRSDLLVSVGVEVLLDVVDSHATCERTKERVRILGDALVRAVAVLEVHHSGPIVGEILFYVSVIGDVVIFRRAIPR
jgi:hypothetical protein